MKKTNLDVKLHLKKKKIASLGIAKLNGGMRPVDHTTVDNSLGKQSTCPIETCTCDPEKL